MNDTGRLFKTHASAGTHGITAVDLSRVIRRMSHIFATGELGNYETSDALAHLAEFLHNLGPAPVDQLHKLSDRQHAEPQRDRPSEYDDLPLESVEQVLANHTTTKADLVKLARARFGMPESRLRRLPIAAVLDAVRAAAAHEQSLDVIERNAEISGKARQS